MGGSRRSMDAAEKLGSAPSHGEHRTDAQAAFDRSLEQLQIQDRAFRRLLASMPGALFMLDASFGSSPEIRQVITGIDSPSERDLAEMLSTEQAVLCRRRAVETGEVVTFRLVREDRQERRVQEIRLVAMTEESRTIGLLGSVSDVTGEHRARRALRENEVLFRRMFELLPDAVTIVEEDGRIGYINRAGVELMGASRKAQLVGRLIWDFLPSEEQERLRAESESLRKGRQVEFIEQLLQRVDGSSITIEAGSVATVFNGRPAVLVAAHDLTARKRMEQAISDRQRAVAAEQESRSLLYKIFYASPSPISITRITDGTVIDVNDEWCAFSGYSRAEVVGKSVTNLEFWIGSEERELLIELITRHDSVHDFEVEVATRAGGLKTGLLSVQKIQVEGDPCMLTVINDITHRQHALTALKESEARFRMMADSAPVLIWMADEACRRNFFNRPWLAFTGRSLEDEQGLGWIEAVHPDDRKRCLDVERAMDAAPFSIEYRLRRHDGAYRWMLDHGIPRATSTGEFTGFIGSCVDINERKEAEEALREAKEHAEDMARVKSNFITTMTHEIRTPLTVILGFTSILRQGVQREYERFVLLIERSGRRLLLMLDSMLDLAQLEAGTLNLSPRPYNLNDVVYSIGSSIEPLAKEKGLHLDVVVPEKRVYALIDHAVLLRILNNLLDNAIKFTESGRIEVRLSEDEDWAYLTVHDTGVGIDPEFLPELFEPFAQESTGLERTHQGSGLGLAVSKRLLGLMNARIEVASRKGEGSIFTIILPRAKQLSPR